MPLLWVQLLADGSEGAARGGGHFVCGKCVEGYAKAKVNPEGFASFAAASRQLVCSALLGCPLHFAVCDLLRAVSPMAAATLEAARAKVMKQRVMAALQEALRISSRTRGGRVESA